MISLKKYEEQNKKLRTENENILNQLNSRNYEYELLLKELEKVREENELFKEENLNKNQDIEELRNLIIELQNNQLDKLNFNEEDVVSSRTNEEIIKMDKIKEEYDKKIAEIEDYKNVNEKLIIKIDNLNNEIKEKDINNKEKDGTIENLKQLIQKKDDEINLLKKNEAIISTNEENSMSKIGISSLNDAEKIEKYKNEINEYKSRINNNDNLINNLKDEIRELRNKNSELKKQLENYNLNNLQNQNLTTNELKNIFDEKNKEIDKLNDLLKEKEKNLQKKDEEINKLKKEVYIYTSNRTEENIPTDKFSTSRISNSSLNDAEKIEKYKKKIQDLKSELNAYQSQYSILKKDIKELSTKNEALQNKKIKENEELNNLFHVAFENYNPKKKEQIDAFQKLSEYFGNDPMKKKKGLFGLFNK